MLLNLLEFSSFTGPCVSSTSRMIMRTQYVCSLSIWLLSCVIRDSRKSKSEGEASRFAPQMIYLKGTGKRCVPEVMCAHHLLLMAYSCAKTCETNLQVQYVTTARGRGVNQVDWRWLCIVSSCHTMPSLTVFFFSLKFSLVNLNVLQNSHLKNVNVYLLS